MHTGPTVPAHVSMECKYQYGELHAPPRHAYSGLFRGLYIPLAASHQRAQLLLISWVTRSSRWASALGGSAVDMLEEEEGRLATS